MLFRPWTFVMTENELKLHSPMTIRRQDRPNNDGMALSTNPGYDQILLCYKQLILCRVNYLYATKKLAILNYYKSFFHGWLFWRTHLSFEWSLPVTDGATTPIFGLRGERLAKDWPTEWPTDWLIGWPIGGNASSVVL